MKFLKTTLAFFILFLAFLSAFPKPKDPLTECWKQQVSKSQGYVMLSYQETVNKFEHSFEPWQQTNYTGKGKVWSNANAFFKADTLSVGTRVYFSKTNFSGNTLLFLDHGDQELFPVTKEMVLDQPFLTARYSPNILLQYFVDNKIAVSNEKNKDFAIYNTRINKTHVSLFIRKLDNILEKVTTLSADDLFGDVLTTITYSNFVTLEKVFYPKNILVQSINGKIKDEVKINAVTIANEAPALLVKPADYTLKNSEETQPEIKVDKYSDNIHFIELKHTDDKVMVVEFKDHLLVAEAPINSKNGELIIREAKKIAPGKPIRYFVFGHYHPHYLGGIRPFVHKGANIICTKPDQDYVSYLVNASHTLNPDSLQLQPKPLKFREVKDSLTLSDGSFEMKIFFIGKKSEHTNDYLVYYFPKEKMLFEDDLVWIARTGDIRKASGRQAGLYNAVKELRLDVKTIVQSWPVADYGVKTVIPFEDLEKSMYK
jgi:glyoxylase-like metal-dependent hydrolase (beta-lactamase superfamily II)